MPTTQSTPNPHPDLLVRSTMHTLRGSLNISIQLAGEHGTPTQAFEELRDYLRQHEQLPASMSDTQLRTAHGSLISTMVLAEDGLLDDPYSLLTLDALDATLADLTPGTSGAQA